MIRSRERKAAKKILPGQYCRDPLEMHSDDSRSALGQLRSTWINLDFEESFLGAFRSYPLNSIAVHRLLPSVPVKYQCLLSLALGCSIVAMAWHSESIGSLAQLGHCGST